MCVRYTALGGLNSIGASIGTASGNRLISIYFHNVKLYDIQFYLNDIGLGGAKGTSGHPLVRSSRVVGSVPTF